MRAGRFATPPVEPGIYTFELRVLKTAPPALYFLLLAGAKPVSLPMADKDAVLMMNAQVRKARSVTGQVTARRLRIAVPAGTAANQPAPVASAPTPAATPTAFMSRSQAVAVGRTAAPARVAVPAQMSHARVRRRWHPRRHQCGRHPQHPASRPLGPQRQCAPPHRPGPLRQAAPPAKRIKPHQRARRPREVWSRGLQAMGRRSSTASRMSGRQSRREAPSGAGCQAGGDVASSR
jgi:hypothetical protein